MATIVVSSVLACHADSNVRLEQLQLTDGSRLEQFTGPDSAVVLLLDPSECFSCNPTIERWLRWARQEPPSIVHVVLTRSPVDAENNRIVLEHVPVDAVLAATRHSRSLGERRPLLLMFVGRRVALRAHIAAGRDSSNDRMEVFACSRLKNPPAECAELEQSLIKGGSTR